MEMPEKALDLAMGEARVLVGQLAGEPAENIGGWTLAFQRVEDHSIGLASSAISLEAGPMKASVLFMLLDAARGLADELSEGDVL